MSVSELSSAFWIINILEPKTPQFTCLALNALLNQAELVSSDHFSSPEFSNHSYTLERDFHPGWQSRQHIQMGPKQSLLPNSTETPSPTRGWEALPRTGPRGASSQGPGHRVMGRRNLSGDNRPWRKAPGECACTGVRQDTSESDRISESREGHFRKDRLSMTLPEKEPCLTLFLLPPLLGFFLRQSLVLRR